jgi:uncharacterized protein YgiM (DUF1202 family)
MKLKRMFAPGLLSLLALLLASPAAQAYSGIYYVIPTSAPLRECASPACAVLSTVYQGDRVEILERTDTGWSHVRLADRAAMGWIPSDQISYSSTGSGGDMPTYYVNTDAFPLRDAPKPDARVITTMRFNEAVEMLGVGTSGWAQVRILQSNVVGYMPPRNLSNRPLDSSQPTRRRRAPARKAPPKEEKAPPAAPSAM